MQPHPAQSPLQQSVPSPFSTSADGVTSCSSSYAQGGLHRVDTNHRHPRLQNARRRAEGDIVGDLEPVEKRILVYLKGTTVRRNGSRKGSPKMGASSRSN